MARGRCAAAAVVGADLIKASLLPNASLRSVRYSCTRASSLRRAIKIGINTLTLPRNNPGPVAAGRPPAITRAPPETTRLWRSSRSRMTILRFISRPALLSGAAHPPTADDIAAGEFLSALTHAMMNASTRAGYV